MPIDGTRSGGERYPELSGRSADARSTGESKATDAAGHRNPIPRGVAYRDEIYDAAVHHHIDPMWLAAQAAQESGGPGADSGRNVLQIGGNGHGVFQLDPAGGYGPWLRAHHDGLDVRENADEAATIDEGNLKVYGSMRDAMTTYNAGHDSVRDSAITQWPDGQRLHYADSVERHLRDLEALAARQR